MLHCNDVMMSFFGHLNNPKLKSNEAKVVEKQVFVTSVIVTGDTSTGTFKLA